MSEKINPDFFEEIKTDEDAQPEIVEIKAADPESGLPIEEKEQGVVHYPDKIAATYVESLERDAVNINEGRAPGVVGNIAEVQEPGVLSNTVAKEGVLEITKDVPESVLRERVQKGLEMLWVRFAMQPGFMKGKGESVLKLLVQAGVLEAGEAASDKTINIVKELADAMDTKKADEIFKQKTAGQIK